MVVSGRRGGELSGCHMAAGIISSFTSPGYASGLGRARATPWAGGRARVGGWPRAHGLFHRRRSEGCASYGERGVSEGRTWLLGKRGRDPTLRCAGKRARLRGIGDSSRGRVGGVRVTSAACTFMQGSSLPLPWRLQALASGDGDSDGVGEGLTMDSEAAARIRFVGDG